NNFQFGYAFSEQPTKADYSAAILAIAEAGYTDPGACNPVRNFRLPGSVNLKPGNDGFVSRLIEFHPKREFTLEQLIEAFDVTPAEADSSSFRPIRLADVGEDDVLQWLVGQGLVLSQPNPEGWCGVVCPNHAEHSDGHVEGRYMPVNRAFCCYHGHCQDWNSARFLEWVEAQGGPSRQSGLRDDLIAAVMSGTLSKLTPTDAFPDAAAEVIREVEMREIGRLERASWFQRFAYVEDDDAYFDLQSRRELRRGTFNAVFRHIQCRSLHSSKQRVEASVWYDQHRVEMGGRSLVGLTFAAGESVLCSKDGDVYANRWRDARPPGCEGDATRWLKHVERMLPDRDEREHVLNVMAFKVQNPHIKINHAVLHAGIGGSGKDTMWYPFLYAIGGRSLTNVKLVRNEDVNSQWGYSLESEVVVINELRQAEAKDRRALENTLKPLLAAPPEYLPVNRKGMHPYDALNRLQVIAFSNERAAISLPSEDRRWFVVWSDAPRMDDAAARSMWAWYRAEGFDII
ncbi:MAG: primase-helicase family protein, partial [Synechococcus sp.]|nr:primase-helicase family protein [Synechococcus sp.]